MRRLKYGDSSFSVRLEYPVEWTPTTLSGVKLQILDEGGNELLAAASATSYTATTTNATATATDSTITLANTATAVVRGDRLYITDSAAGPAETVEVLSYNSSTKVATLRDALLYDHTSGTAVYGLWCTYAANLSTVATWTEGLRVVLRWQPQGNDDLYYDEMAEVASVAGGSPAFWKEFEARYPVEYRAVNERDLPALEKLYREDLTEEFLAHNLDINRLKDQRVTARIFPLFCRMQILSGGGGEQKEEYDRARREFYELFQVVCENRVLWVDTDGDGVKSDSEEDSHGPIFDIRCL